MCHLEKSYERFRHAVDVGRVYENPYLRFSTVCRFLRVSPRDLDELLFRELGMSGEEILQSRRNSIGIN